jgi:phytoene desaturase
VGARAKYSKIVHHNVHLGRDWNRGWDEVTDRGELMSDPSLLVTHPTWTDNSAAPPGRDTYSVQVPAPNLRVAPVSWSEAMSRRYAGELMAALELRGYLDLGLHLEVSQVETPATFARVGSLGPGNLPSTVVSTRLAVGVPMLLHSGRLAALRVLA